MDGFFNNLVESGDVLVAGCEEAFERLLAERSSDAESNAINFCDVMMSYGEEPECRDTILEFCYGRLPAYVARLNRTRLSSSQLITMLLHLQRWSERHIRLAA